MKVAVIGSRNLHTNTLDVHLPEDTTQIISGGAKGIDNCAKLYAQKHAIEYIEILPEYEKYGKAAPLKRNDAIIECSDLIIAYWDGKSKGTEYTIKKCKKLNKKIKIILMQGNMEKISKSDLDVNKWIDFCIKSLKNGYYHNYCDIVFYDEETEIIENWLMQCSKLGFEFALCLKEIDSKRKGMSGFTNFKVGQISENSLIFNLMYYLDADVEKGFLEMETENSKYVLVSKPDRDYETKKEKENLDKHFSEDILKTIKIDKSITPQEAERLLKIELENMEIKAQQMKEKILSLYFE